MQSWIIPTAITVAVVCFVLVKVLNVAIKKLDKIEAKGKKPRPKRRAASGDDYWEDVPFTKIRPDGKWAVIPGAPEGKLVTIRDMAGQQGARDDIVRAILEADAVVLSAKREPDNPHDANAVAIFGSINNGQAVQVGYAESWISGSLAKSFSTEMPIAAEIRKIRSNGQQVYIGVNVLVPVKKTRDGFEIP